MSMSCTFQYQPIDQQSSSIRLIRLLRGKSADGHVQCRIQHASTEASYICLSYVWGDEDDCYTILMNGKSFKVRHNLHRFLHQARRSRHLPRTWIWIDALCINQSDTLERNHQVQQMGAIFSRAKNVVSWLGDERNIAKFLLYVGQRTKRKENDERPGTALLGIPGLGSSFHYLCVAEYWNRAWITQEVALARNITLMAANIELDRSLFPVLSHLGQGYLARLELLRLTNDANWKNRSLVYLMDKFKLKESRIPRDRIYSLLALCNEGKELQVDYVATDQNVAKDIIRCCEQSFCLCTIDTVTFILQLKPLHRSDTIWNSGLQPFGVMTLPVFSKDAVEILCSARPCLWRGCDGSERSHLPGFVEMASPSCTLLSIHLYLRRICTSYKSTFVTINWMADESNFVGHWSRHGPGGYKSVGFVARHDHCSWVLAASGKSCTVMFSFELLVEIARLGRDSSSRICARVADIGAESAPSHGDPVMRMHFWDPSQHGNEVIQGQLHEIEQ
jgi:hypothetical protein